MAFFREILGQDEAIHQLRLEYSRDRLYHAYLFEGRPGTGRYTLARALATFLLCESPHEGDACGLCRACRNILANRHPDLLEIPREDVMIKKERLVSEEGESIGHPPLLTFLHWKPVVADRRIALLPDAERMNEAASNAFLKTLEEPPGKAILLLTTSARDRLLPTIVSRCRPIQVRPLPLSLLARELERRGVAEGENAYELARLSCGSLGAAIHISKGEVLDHWQWIQSAFRVRTPAGALALAKGMIERAQNAATAAGRRERAKELLDLAALHLRDSLRKGESPRGVEGALEALWRAGEQLIANVRLELVLHAAAFEAIAALRQG